nr:MAG TPA: hypothetical protein [Caudoviricetes sp.]
MEVINSEINLRSHDSESEIYLLKISHSLR